MQGSLEQRGLCACQIRQWPQQTSQVETGGEHGVRMRGAEP